MMVSTRMMLRTQFGQKLARSAFVTRFSRLSSTSPSSTSSLPSGMGSPCHKSVGRNQKSDITAAWHEIKLQYSAKKGILGCMFSSLSCPGCLWQFSQPTSIHLLAENCKIIRATSVIVTSASSPFRLGWKCFGSLSPGSWRSSLASWSWAPQTVSCHPYTFLLCMSFLIVLRNMTTNENCVTKRKIQGW